MSALAPILKRVSPHHRLLASAAYVVGLVFVCIFPSFDRRTEIEEHALIPGYANSGFHGDWPRVLRGAMAKIEAEESLDVALGRALADAELIAHRVDFVVPAGLRNSSAVYTAVPSKRGDSREAAVLVVATNWTAGKRSTAKASMGLGIGVVLAQYLKTVQWLSKDVFVVFVDSSLPYGAGARAWLHAYFGGTSAVRRGVLRQAVVLDVVRGSSGLLCDVEGVNGAVPNQDIVNSFVIGARDKPGLPTFHREAWDSVWHHFGNGGVHSSHAPFLEYQVPAFTIRGRRAGKRQAIDIDSLARSVEGILRCFSNNLQQLHHSFNFYFFTGPDSHISSGLYLYPVFAMQLPLLSFLLTTASYRDIRALLVGLGVVAVMIVVAGSPVFLLATNARLLAALGSLREPLLAVPACERPGWGEADALSHRHAAALWLASGAAAAAAAALFLRRYAYTVFGEEAPGGEAPDVGGRGKGVRLPGPLWEAVRSSSGFAFLIILAPVTILSWAVAVPLTVVCVPMLILMRPVSLRRRPLRSLLLLAFLAGNAFLLAAPPAARAAVLGGYPRAVALWACDLHDGVLLPAVPREVRPYMPVPLVRWLREGRLGASLEGDLLQALYEAAKDFHCVGGMLFPVFCFVYWPLLALVVLVGCVLPAQRVDDEGLTARELRLLALFVLFLLVSGVVGGVLWRSSSSKGLGQLQW